MRAMEPDSGTELICATLRAHLEGIFGLAAIASELRVRPYLLEDFLDANKPRPLPPSVTHELVRLMFHGRATWDEKSDTLRAGAVASADLT